MSTGSAVSESAWPHEVPDYGIETLKGLSTAWVATNKGRPCWRPLGARK